MNASAVELGEDDRRLVASLLDGRRSALARAITLIESRRPDHRRRAAAVLDSVLPRTGSARRVGITGVPGVGKSTMIDSLGTILTARRHRVAVLAVDPSSSRTGGAILGDKTRMSRLATDPNAFVRPSPTGGTLGGVAGRTRESMLLCEAAGSDIVLVETVGTGQSETAVADMVDTFVVVMLPGAGDELQGIKKGVLELADVIAVNKADMGDGRAATNAARDCHAAIRILFPAGHGWVPPVLTISGLTGAGLESLWQAIERHRAQSEASGAFAQKRRGQQVTWMWTLVESRVRETLTGTAFRQRTRALEEAVRDNTMSATTAAAQMTSWLGLDQ